MKCKDCYARNGESVCLIGMKARMLTCGHYGCNLQQRTVERHMGISKPLTNADRIRAMSDEELAQYLICDVECEAIRRAGRYVSEAEINRAITDCADWLRKEADT